MNLSTEALQEIERLGEKYGVTLDLNSSNVIDYLNELSSRWVAYELRTSILWLVAWLLIVGLCIRICRKCIKNMSVYSMRRSSIDAVEDENIVYFICGIIILIGIVVISLEIHDIYKCVKVPEMWIIEYLSAKL